MRMNLYQGTITEKYYKNSVVLTQARGAKKKKKGSMGNCQQS